MALSHAASTYLTIFGCEQISLRPYYYIVDLLRELTSNHATGFMQQRFYAARLDRQRVKLILKEVVKAWTIAQITGGFRGCPFEWQAVSIRVLNSTYPDDIDIDSA